MFQKSCECSMFQCESFSVWRVVSVFSRSGAHSLTAAGLNMTRKWQRHTTRTAIWMTISCVSAAAPPSPAWATASTTSVKFNRLCPHPAYLAKEGAEGKGGERGGHGEGGGVSPVPTLCFMRSSPVPTAPTALQWSNPMPIHSFLSSSSTYPLNPMATKREVTMARAIAMKRGKWAGLVGVRQVCMIKILNRLQRVI